MTRPLEDIYSELHKTCLTPMARTLENHIAELLRGVERIDRVSSRAKDISKFITKSSKLNLDGKPKYSSPLEQIQDQIGARIITFFLDDIDKISKFILENFRAIEDQTKEPESEWEFGYFGKHFILYLPTDVTCDYDQENCPKLFELQIKTLFQHAWSEANHDIGYKPKSTDRINEDTRKIAFASAQAWGADEAFNQLHLKKQNVAEVIPLFGENPTD